MKKSLLHFKHYFLSRLKALARLSHPTSISPTVKKERPLVPSGSLTSQPDSSISDEVSKVTYSFQEVLKISSLS